MQAKGRLDEFPKMSTHTQARPTTKRRLTYTLPDDVTLCTEDLGIERYPVVRQGDEYAPIGTRRPIETGYISIKTETGWKAEHRHVMEQILGRQLVKGENVHHKNGLRDDNSPDNLELWIVPQPSGQRVDDIISYVAKYHPDKIMAAIVVE